MRDSCCPGVRVGERGRAMISLKRLKLLSLAVLVIGAGWLAVCEIRERGALASKQLAMAAREAIERGEHDLAMLLALEGLPAGKGQLLAMDSLQARFVLNEARLRFVKDEVLDNSGSETVHYEFPWRKNPYGQPWILKGREEWRDTSDLATVDVRGEIATSLDQDGNLVVIDLINQVELISYALPDPTEGVVQISGDGSRIAILTESRTDLLVLPDSTGESGQNSVVQTMHIEHDDYYFYEVAFVDEATIVLFEDCYDEYYVWDLKNGTLTETLFDTEEFVYCGNEQTVLFFADSEGGDNADLLVLDLASGGRLKLEEPEEDWFLFNDDLSITLHGEWIIARNEGDYGDPKLAVWNGRSGELVVFQSLAAKTELLWFGKDGYLGYMPGSTMLIVGTVSINEPPNFHEIDGGLSSLLHVNTDGSQVVFSRRDHTIVLFDLHSKQVLQEFKGHRDVVHGVLIGNQEDILVSSSADGDARVWDVSSGDLVHILKGHENALGTVLSYDTESDGFREYIVDYLQDAPWETRQTGDGNLLLAEPAALGIEIWDVSHDDGMITSACSSLTENRRSLTAPEYARYGLKPREEGPCDRHGPFSPEFWRGKAKNLGFLQ